MVKQLTWATTDCHRHAWLRANRDKSFMGNDFKIIGSKFRAVLIPHKAGQSMKSFTRQQVSEEGVWNRQPLQLFVTQCVLSERLLGILHLHSGK